MRIYLDASPIIYWVEKVLPFHALAMAAACDVFLTNDAGLKAFHQIAVEVVS